MNERWPGRTNATASGADGVCGYIGGDALKYRSEGGSFVLYSIGWNEADDGGVTDAKREVTGDLTKKDWVWPFQEAGGK